MGFNIIELQVVTDYTDFSDTVRFHLNVPVLPSDAEAIYKALGSGPKSGVESAITAGVNANASTTIQNLVKQLLAAYDGTDSSGKGGTSPTPTPPLSGNGT